MLSDILARTLLLLIYGKMPYMGRKMHMFEDLYYTKRIHYV